MAKKVFVSPELQVIRMSQEDLLSTSNGTVGFDWNDGDDFIVKDGYENLGGFIK